VAVFALAGCANRPVNPPLAKADPAVDYRVFNRPQYVKDGETPVVLAFSGVGTPAVAASSAGLVVLTPITLNN